MTDREVEYCLSRIPVVERVKIANSLRSCDETWYRLSARRRTAAQTAALEVELIARGALKILAR